MLIRLAMLGAVSLLVSSDALARSHCLSFPRERANEGYLVVLAVRIERENDPLVVIRDLAL